MEEVKNENVKMLNEAETVKSPKLKAEYVSRKVKVTRKMKNGEMKEYNYECLVPRRVYKRIAQPALAHGRPKQCRTLIEELAKKLCFADQLEILNHVCEHYFNGAGDDKIRVEHDYNGIKGYCLIHSKTVDGKTTELAQAIQQTTLKEDKEITAKDIVDAEIALDKIAGPDPKVDVIDDLDIMDKITILGIN